ncbi:MAG TPA: hypothetical protein VHT24_11895 [Pseudacidobacterium sp.]|jgi:hypothetical protein|nr:hypothetical protein [Pseudacidobacterium sp.]
MLMKFAKWKQWSAAFMLLVVGCGGGKSSNSGSSFSNPPAASQTNNYAGTQTYKLFSDGYDETGGVWNLILDDVNQFFTYTDISIPPITFGGGGPTYPLEGSTKAAGNFIRLSLNGKSSGSGGYAIEIPGRAAIMRPGDTSVLPVISAAASTSGCQGPMQNTTFEFLTLWPLYNNMAPPYASYGSIQASSDGSTWKFSNLQMFTPDGTSLNPPAPSTGLCSYTTEGYVATILPGKETQSLPWTVVVGPSGYMVIDQGQGNGPSEQPPQVSNASIGPFGLVGFPQPSSQIDTNALVSGNYIGFTYESYADAVGRPVTQPVAFSRGTGTVATGGLYTNDDVTQTPPDNLTMDLGPEDSQTNGLYKSVTVTMPDLYNSCVNQSYGGTDANGNPTCIAHGVAIAGLVEGKYVLYVALKDRSLETKGLVGTAELEYFLYQQ